MRLQEIIQEAQDHAQEPRGESFVIAVCGGSATGKSYLASNQITEALGNDILVFEQDVYQLGEDFTEKDTSPYKWDDPANFQVARMADDLRALKAGNSVQVPQFTVQSVRSNHTVEVIPKPVILVDGIYSGANELRDTVDRTVYVELPLYARFLRRLFRMTYDHEIPRPDVAFKHSFGPVLRAHQAFVAPQKEHADCIITGSYSFEETISRYNLQSMEDIRPGEIVWQHKSLAFGVDQTADTPQFSVSYDGETYSKFAISLEQLAVFNAVANLSEL